MFGLRKSGTCAGCRILEGEVERLKSAMRQLDSEQAAMHHDVRRWMRRATAAERTVLRTQGAAPAPAQIHQAPILTGVRARMAARRQRLAFAPLIEEPPPTTTNGDEPPAGGDDGVHP